MSLDELKERIKEEVILREGDLFEWQWQQLGLITEAEAAGVPTGNFLKIVNDVSRSINPYFGRISDLKINVADQARQARKKLTTSQVDQIVADAARLQLGAAFVKNRWLPSILATIPEPQATAPIATPVVSTLVLPPTQSPVVTPIPPANPARREQSVQPVSSRPVPLPTGPDRDAMMQKVHQFLDEYKTDNCIPASVLKTLFLATNFDETLLADAVLAYLSANFYAAQTPVQGENLKARLLSTNWRHLSWWVVSPVKPETSIVAPPMTLAAPRGSSDMIVIGMAVLVVGLLIGGVWWSMRQKTVTFVELFADNHRDWPSGKVGNFEYEVAHSAYFIRRMSTNRDGQLGRASIELPNDIDLNGAASFRVEVEMVVPKTVRIKSGLMVGVGNGQQCTSFLIRGTDSFLVRNIDGEIAETALLADSRRVGKSIHIDTQSNTLRVEKRKGQLFFSINGQNMPDSPVAFRPFAGNGIGFVSAAEAVKFVNLRVVANP